MHTSWLMGSWWWLYMRDLISMQSNDLEYNYIFESLKEKIMYPCWKLTKWSIRLLKISKCNQQRQSVMLLRNRNWERRMRLVPCCVIITKATIHITANPVMPPEEIMLFFSQLSPYISISPAGIGLIWHHGEANLQSKLAQNCSLWLLQPYIFTHFSARGTEPDTKPFF